MPITIGSNIASIRAQRLLSESTSRLAKTFEKLSSGLRINRAADDAAGLSISASLNSDTRVFNQGIRNFSDGLSLLNIADSAIESLSNITVRLKELAEQSANGTYSSIQRAVLDKEAQALSKEYNRIVQSTTFNGKNLLNSSFGDLRLQGGYGLDGGIQSNIGGAAGLGTLSTAVTYNGSYSSMDVYTDDIKLADLNGDGYLDMLTSGIDDGFNGFINIRLGSESGRFGTDTRYVTGSPGRSTSVEVGDLNGDGVLDVVASGYSDTFVMLGRGNGTFNQQRTYFMESTPGYRGTQLGDLNGDGILDLVVAGYELNIRLGVGDGTFGAVRSLSGAGSYGMPNAVQLGDLNNDGILDIVYANNGSTAGRLGNGNGIFGSEISYGSSTSIKLGDVNGDGILDLAQGTGANVSIKLGNGNGTFGTATTYTGHTSVMDYEFADLNSDGHADLITTGASGFVATRMGNGSGTFGTISSYAIGAAGSSIAVGDINNDGVADIAATGTPGMGREYATVHLTNTAAGVAPLLQFSLKTKSDSLQALTQFTQTQNRLSSQRGKIGAYQSRLNTAVNVLAAASENYTIAEGRISNADIAFESSQLVREGILQKAAASVLAQANVQPALALKLLQE